MAADRSGDHEIVSTASSMSFAEGVAAGAPSRAPSPGVARPLSDVEFVVLRGAGPNRRVAAGDVLFRKGEIGHCMYAIETGQVRIEFGDGMPHKFLGPREYFGELALFIGNHARVATAVAHTSCSLRLIEYPAFNHLLETEPAILAQFMRRSFAYLVASEQQLIAHLKRRNEDLLVTLDSLRQTQSQLSTANRLVRTDELTGLVNRRGLYQYLESLDEQRVAGTDLSLLLIDLDNFKLINDEYGHLAGDQVLSAVAEEVSRTAQACDLAARLGGDEFALLAQLADPGDVAALAARLVETIGELRFSAPLESLRVTVSVGVSRCNDDSDWSTWYSQADAALYRAKGEGGSTWSLHA